MINDTGGPRKETLLDKRLRIRQEPEGYRFSIDSLLLAHHISLKPGEVGVDLGTGCGVVPIILADRYPSAAIHGVEIQANLAQTASQNIRDNNMADRVRIIHGDLKNSEKLLGAGMADVVFSNPPYRPVGTGRMSPNSQRAVAKHEIRARLFDVLSAARVLLRRSGHFWVIYPANRLVDLLTEMRACHLEPKRMRLVHSRPESSGELVLVAGVKEGNPGISVLPALITHDRKGGLTAEAARMVGTDG